ncbi:MAG: hypothetical protein ACFE0I_16935 [Elainellaceae cyanobacterium]
MSCQRGIQQILRLLIVCLIVGGFCAIALPVQATELCRTINDQHICILDIKRSAKNYWEYRAVISIDGERKPMEVYNCRDRTKTQDDGTVVRFEQAGAGTLICRLLNG